MYVAVCRMCGTEKKINMNHDQMERVQSGEKIQNVVPYLSAGDRELMISGTCGSCFDKMFGGDE